MIRFILEILQLILVLVIDLFKNYPGLPGLFLSAIASGALRLVLLIMRLHIIYFVNLLGLGHA